MRMVACLLATFAALAAALPAAAAPFGVRLGIEKIVLDSPPGFTDTTDLASPRLQDLAATLTPASNRILLFALSDGDVRRFSQGEQLEARRYMVAVTPRGLEHQRISPEQFAAFAADSLQGLGKAVENPDLIKFLESQPIGKANLISELRMEPALMSVMQATRLPELPGTTFWQSKKPQYLCFTTTVLLVRGKALQLQVYTLYDGPADTEWLRDITRRWQDELLRLNR